MLSSATVVSQPQPTLSTVLKSFTGNPDGSGPVLPLVLGADSALYGSTFSGGTDNEGTIFKINRDGTGYSVLHHFTAEEQTVITPFSTPGAFLLMGRDGILYGTAFGGSTYLNGFVFKLNTDGSGYGVLHSFTNTDGHPLNLIHGTDGDLYGASLNSIFKLDTAGGNYAVLHTFNSGTDGAQTYGRLLQVNDGTLFGAARSGGTNGNFGTIFKINTNGIGFSVLHTFGGPDDGAMPYAGLVEGSDGFLYGVTERGGSNDAGTVFKINREGLGYEILHHFQTNGVDGAKPYGGVTPGLNSFLYGTTISGGTNNQGTIFRIGLNGDGYEILRHFNSVESGSAPYGALVQGPVSDGSGVMYGTTQTAGAAGYGNLFALIVNPPISITPTLGQSGGSPVVFWPAWAINYQLQTTTNLTTGTWVTTSNYIPVTGAQLTNNLPGAYYRLVWPQ